MKKLTSIVSIITMICFAFFLLAFNQSEVTENATTDNRCCCQYKNPQTNLMAPYSYDWMSRDDCSRIFAGSCTGDSREECSKK